MWILNVILIYTNGKAEGLWGPLRLCDCWDRLWSQLTEPLKRANRRTRGRTVAEGVSADFDIPHKATEERRTSSICQGNRLGLILKPIAFLMSGECTALGPLCYPNRQQTGPASLSRRTTLRVSLGCSPETGVRLGTKPSTCTILASSRENHDGTGNGCDGLFQKLLKDLYAMSIS